MMNVYFVATKWTPTLENFLRSLRKHKFKYTWLGKNTEWTNFKDKSKLIYENIPDNDDIVIISDAYDVLVNRNCEEIEESFKSYKKPIVVGSEWYCGSKKNCKPIQHYWDHLKYEPSKKYLNAGFLMGVSKEIKEMYKFLKEKDDDQYAMATYLLENKDKFAVDHANHLVQNVHFFDRTMENPFFFHFPGPLLKHGFFPQYNAMAKKILDNLSYQVYPHEVYYFIAFVVFLLIIEVYLNK